MAERYVKTSVMMGDPMMYALTAVHVGLCLHITKFVYKYVLYFGHKLSARGIRVVPLGDPLLRFVEPITHMKMLRRT